MSNDNVFFARNLVAQATRERDSVLAAIGNKLIHAPSRIIRMGSLQPKHASRAGSRRSSEMASGAIVEPIPCLSSSA